MARKQNRSRACKNITQRGIGSHSVHEMQQKVAAIKAQAALQHTEAAQACVKDPATPYKELVTPDNGTKSPASESSWLKRPDEMQSVASEELCRSEADQDCGTHTHPPKDESSPVDGQSQVLDTATPAEDKAETALQAPAISKENGPVAPSSPAALHTASAAPNLPAVSSSDSSAESQGNITEAADSTEQLLQLQVTVTSKDSLVTLSSPAALPATSSATVPPASSPESMSDIDVSNEARSAAKPQGEGLPGDASQSPLCMAPTLPTTQCEEQQVIADFGTRTGCASLPVTPPMGSGTAGQAHDNGKEADIAEEWPRGLTRWAVLLCGRLQAKTPKMVRPLVDVAVAAAVEVLAASAAISAVCF